MVRKVLKDGYIVIKLDEARNINPDRKYELLVPTGFNIGEIKFSRMSNLTYKNVIHYLNYLRKNKNVLL